MKVRAVNGTLWIRPAPLLAVILLGVLSGVQAQVEGEPTHTHRERERGREAQGSEGSSVSVEEKSLSPCAQSQRVLRPSLWCPTHPIQCVYGITNCISSALLDISV